MLRPDTKERRVTMIACWIVLGLLKTERIKAEGGITEEELRDNVERVCR